MDGAPGRTWPGASAWVPAWRVAEMALRSTPWPSWRRALTVRRKGTSPGQTARRGERGAVISMIRVTGAPGPTLHGSAILVGMATAEQAIPPEPDFRTTAIIVASALFMEQLDATVLTTALPTMARSFGVSPPAHERRR